MTPPTTTASAQSILKLVRELIARQMMAGHHSGAGLFIETRDSIYANFPEIASLVESQAKRNAELEAENKLLREEWERMNECLVDYVSGCEEFKHRPHCYCLPAVELLSTLKFSPSQK